MIKSISISSVILSLFLLSTNASATVIYTQDFDPLLTTEESGSDFGANRQIANKFSLLGTATQSINTISWLGAYNPSVISPGADDFTLRIFADNGSGAPEVSASVLDINVGNVVNRADTGVDFSPFNIDLYSYQASLGTDITLSSGVDYWLSIVDDFGTSGSNNWRWAASTLTGSNSIFRQFDGDNWALPHDNTLQYELSSVSSVPIPAALWLMISGLAGLATFKRKQHA